MLTQRWPTGGAGVAFPAGSCNLICPMTFSFTATSNRLFDLAKIEFNGRSTPEDRYQHTDLRLFGADLFHGASEVCKRAICDANVVARFEDNAGLWLRLTLGYLLRNRSFTAGDRCGMSPSHDPLTFGVSLIRCQVWSVRFICKDAQDKMSGGHASVSATGFLYVLTWNQDFAEQAFHVRLTDSLFEGVFYAAHIQSTLRRTTSC